MRRHPEMVARRCCGSGTTDYDMICVALFRGGTAYCGEREGPALQPYCRPASIAAAEKCCTARSRAAPVQLSDT